MLFAVDLEKAADFDFPCVRIVSFQYPIVNVRLYLNSARIFFKIESLVVADNFPTTLFTIVVSAVNNLSGRT